MDDSELKRLLDQLRRSQDGQHVNQSGPDAHSAPPPSRSMPGPGSGGQQQDPFALLKALQGVTSAPAQGGPSHGSGPYANRSVPSESQYHGLSSAAPPRDQYPYQYQHHHSGPSYDHVAPTYPQAGPSASEAAKMIQNMLSSQPPPRPPLNPYQSSPDPFTPNESRPFPRSDHPIPDEGRQSSSDRYGDMPQDDGPPNKKTKTDRLDELLQMYEGVDFRQALDQARARDEKGSSSEPVEKADGAGKEDEDHPERMEEIRDTNDGHPVAKASADSLVPEPSAQDTTFKPPELPVDRSHSPDPVPQELPLPSRTSKDPRTLTFAQSLPVITRMLTIDRDSPDQGGGGRQIVKRVLELKRTQDQLELELVDERNRAKSDFERTLKVLKDRQDLAAQRETITTTKAMNEALRQLDLKSLERWDRMTTTMQTGLEMLGIPTFQASTDPHTLERQRKVIGVLWEMVQEAANEMEEEEEE